MGGLAFLLAVTRRGDATRNERRLLVTAALVAVVAAFAGVVIQTVVSSGLGHRAATDTALLGDTLRDQFGTSAIVRMAGLVVFAVGVVVAGRRDPTAGKARWAIAGVGAVATLVSFPLTGHSQSTSPRPLIFVADLVHLSAGSIWVGGLVFLGLAIRRRQDDDRHGRKELAETVEPLLGHGDVGRVRAGRRRAAVRLEADGIHPRAHLDALRGAADRQGVPGARRRRHRALQQPHPRARPSSRTPGAGPCASWGARCAPRSWCWRR